jgi:hypothetical protein
MSNGTRKQTDTRPLSEYTRCFRRALLVDTTRRRAIHYALFCYSILIKHTYVSIYSLSNFGNFRKDPHIPPAAGCCPPVGVPCMRPFAFLRAPVTLKPRKLEAVLFPSRVRNDSFVPFVAVLACLYHVPVLIFSYGVPILRTTRCNVEGRPLPPTFGPVIGPLLHTATLERRTSILLRMSSALAPGLPYACYVSC